MPDEFNPYQLYVGRLTREDVKDLAEFDCGREEIWSRAATEWIIGSDVWESIEKRKTKVWLYRNEQDVIVGFGSLGETRRPWPPLDGKYARLLFIPMLGIDYRFHGQPPEEQFRYSRQIIRHLQFEAIQLFSSHQEAGRSTLPYLTLLVHCKNARAIRLYEKFGFLVDRAPSRGDQLLMVLHIVAE